jgi:N-acetylglucosaminyldiphosphoundecaprenol N-acetyl-beta-D-mannosaminyltransferase
MNQPEYRDKRTPAIPGLPPSTRYDVLGTLVEAIDPPRTLAVIENWIRSPGGGHTICVCNVHGVTLGIDHPDIRNAHNRADLVVPDGMPLVWIGRRRHLNVSRVYGPDLMLATLAIAAQKGYTSFFYGGADGVADDLKNRMETRFPGLKVVGTFTPPFRPLTADEEGRILDTLARLQPDLLWIGIGAPKQELLMASWKNRVRAKVMIGVGAAFDFHTERVPQAPRWMMNLGLEWLFRLLTNPRRLWKRYLLGNTRFLWALLLETAGKRRKSA